MHITTREQLTIHAVMCTQYDEYVSTTNTNCTVPPSFALPYAETKSCDALL